MKRIVAIVNKANIDMVRKELGRKRIPSKLWEDILVDWSVSRVDESKKYEPVQVIIQVNDDVYEIFKEAVRYVYGNKKGSVSKAVQEALLKYLNDKVKTNENKKKAVKEYFEQKTFKG